MTRGVVLHRMGWSSDDVVGVEAIAFEIAHFAQAAGMLEIAYVASRELACASLSAHGYVENQQGLSRLSGCHAHIWICVRELIQRCVVRHQQAGPGVD